MISDGLIVPFLVIYFAQFAQHAKYTNLAFTALNKIPLNPKAHGNCDGDTHPSKSPDLALLYSVFGTLRNSRIRR